MALDTGQAVSSFSPPQDNRHGPSRGGAAQQAQEHNQQRSLETNMEDPHN